MAEPVPPTRRLTSYFDDGTASKRPWVPVVAQMHDHAMTVAGVPAREYYWDARTFVKTYWEVAEYYGMDIITPVADVYNFEIEAMGGKMVYSDNAMPTIDFSEPLIKQPEDLHHLKTPDFYRDGRLPYALKYLKLRQNPWGICCAIFSMAVGLRSFPVLVKDMRKRPEFVAELFTFIIDRVQLPYLKVQKEYCGISAAHCADAWAAVPNLSVQEIMEGVVPYNQRLMNKAGELGIMVDSGSGDYCEEDPDKFDAKVLHGAFDIQLASHPGKYLSLGMGNWHQYPLEPVREYTAKYRAQGINIAIKIGVSARLLHSGPVAMIVNSIKRFIDFFARDHELTISIANIPADTPPAHVHAAVAAVHTYGRLPIADDLDKVKFELPQRETFQEWQKQRPSN